MATKRGPKSRKKRSAAKRAWFSMSKGTRKAIRRNYIKQTGSRKGLGKYKTQVGKSVRKARIRRGNNPNTGTGSATRHSLRRAAATGVISSSQKKRTVRRIRRSPSVRAAATTTARSARVSVRKTGGMVASTSKALSRAGRTSKPSRSRPASGTKKSPPKGTTTWATRANWTSVARIGALGNKGLGGNKPTGTSPSSTVRRTRHL